eukprot:CAMPEP_0182496920 /NCGR_PEP_ID=MMETSP1321-20130603/5494_1 /TAXON_ID=91990 /ORGANISM="Bolidomonas sp., Strain RCC1657" /LENGTH=269 /DNA_ID=CAMNT_0024700655 /DNA_START=346 /DNA_END=1151 /DNA_ORIENTATION=+
MVVANLTFATLFLIGYHFELRKAKEHSDRTYTSEVAGKEINNAAREWNFVMYSLERTVDSKVSRKNALVDELPFIQSQVVFAIRNAFYEKEQEYQEIHAAAKERRLSKLSEESFNEIYGHDDGTTKAGEAMRVLGGKYQRILDRINEEFAKAAGEQVSRGTSTVLEIARMDHLEYVMKYLENDGLEWGTVNPMQVAKPQKSLFLLGGGTTGGGVIEMNEIRSLEEIEVEEEQENDEEEQESNEEEQESDKEEQESDGEEQELDEEARET